MDEGSGLHTHSAAMESVSLFAVDEKTTAFVELESVIGCLRTNRRGHMNIREVDWRIRVYDEVGNVIETREQAGEVKKP
jgi:hypothetical protein